MNIDVTIEGKLDVSGCRFRITVGIPGWESTSRPPFSWTPEESKQFLDLVGAQFASTGTTVLSDVEVLQTALGKLLWPFPKEKIPNVKEGEPLQISLTLVQPLETTDQVTSLDSLPWEMALLPKGSRPELEAENDRSNFHIVRRPLVRPPLTAFRERDRKPGYSGLRRPLRVGYAFQLPLESEEEEELLDEEENILRECESAGMTVNRHPTDRPLTVYSVEELARDSDVLWLTAHGDAGESGQFLYAIDGSAVADTALALALRETDVRVVALAVCRLAHGTQSRWYGSFAREVFEWSGAPLVIAPTRDLSYEAGARMLGPLLTSLADGLPVNEVLRRVRKSARGGSRGEHRSLAFFSTLAQGQILGEPIVDTVDETASHAQAQFAQMRASSGEFVRWTASGGFLLHESLDDATAPVEPASDEERSFAMSPKGTIVAEASSGSLRLWTVSRRTGQRRLWGDTGTVYDGPFRVLAVADPVSGADEAVVVLLSREGVTRQLLVGWNGAGKDLTVQVVAEWALDAHFGLLTHSSTLLVPAREEPKVVRGEDLAFVRRALGRRSGDQVRALDLSVRRGTRFALIGLDRMAIIVSDRGAEQVERVPGQTCRLVRDWLPGSNDAALLVVPAAEAGRIVEIDAQ